MATRMNRFAVGALAVVTVLTLSVLGCGGDDVAESNDVQLATATQAAPATPTPALETAETPVVVDELAQIHQAAVDFVDGVLVSSSAECATSERACVEALPLLPASAAEGMVRLIGADAQGGGAGWIVLGQRTDGEWAVLLAGNNLMPPTVPAMLEGEPLGFVCNAADGLNVRSEPSLDGAIVGTLPEGSEVHIEGFVLETEATEAGIGTGWYQISAPVAGWVSSEYLSNIPTLLTCLGNYGAQ